MVSVVVPIAIPSPFHRLVASWAMRDAVELTAIHQALVNRTRLEFLGG